MKKQGFTIVELLVIIVVIGILASISVFAYNGVQAKARDSTRIAHLEKIAEAIQMYRTKNGNDVQTASGCGHVGNGSGWFNLDSNTPSPDPNYTKSILSCLTDAGYLDSSFVDPSNCISNTRAHTGKTCASPARPYMKYSCTYNGQTISVIYARLETKDETSKLTNFNACSSATVASTYSMNYMVIAD
jgi:prepilin-type N-terminal cleavage/methylation domain-containing protein